VTASQGSSTVLRAGWSGTAAWGAAVETETVEPDELLRREVAALDDAAAEDAVGREAVSVVVDRAARRAAVSSIRRRVVSSRL
jgi:hypothetical protein